MANKKKKKIKCEHPKASRKILNAWSSARRGNAFIIQCQLCNWCRYEVRHPNGSITSSEWYEERTS
jgi:hypothetical protein